MARNPGTFRPAQAAFALSALALALALSACQRGADQLPADKTQALIQPVAKVEVASGDAAAAPAAAPPAAEPVPATAPVPEQAALPAAAPPLAAPAPAAPAPVPAGQKAAPESRMVLGEIHFDSGSSALPGDAQQTVEAVATYVTANPGVRIDVSGFADKSGDAAKNAELAKERAQAVRKALLDGGLKEDQIAMKPPQSITGGADDKAARRVELLLAGSAAAAPAASAASAAPAGAAAAPAGGAAKADGKATYDKTCMPCHSTGVAGAPKVGDKAAWAPRIATGIGQLLQSATKGKGAMPPKGGNTALSDAEIKAAVEYMVGQSK